MWLCSSVGGQKGVEEGKVEGRREEGQGEEARDMRFKIYESCGVGYNVKLKTVRERILMERVSRKKEQKSNPYLEIHS